MKIILSFVTIILSVRNCMLLNHTMKCERLGEESNDVHSENDHNNEEITSTADYLDFNNKKIEKVLVPMKDEEKMSVDNDGNIYFQEGEKVFIRKRSDKNATEIEGIMVLANRTNAILIDKTFKLVFVGTHKGLFVLRCGGRRAVKINVTNNIAVDFGIVDGYGNIYFGTDGSITDRTEQLHVFERKTNSLIKIKGIETTLGSYPIESRDNRNKIAIDSKDNVYVGAYSSYVYSIRSGDTMAIKIKDNRDNGGVTAIVIDSRDNVYCRTYTELYVIKNGTFVKILETVDYFDLFVSLDGNDDVHFNIAGEEHILKPKEVSAIEVNGISSDRNVILNKNLMVRNDIFYFTTQSGVDGTEAICAMKSGETNVTEIHKIGEYYSVAVDKHDNIYFTATSSKLSNKTVPYVLRSNAKKPIEICGVASRLISSASADDKNNVYFSAGNGLHVLNFDEVIPHRLRATASNISSVVVAKNDNIYFGTYYDGAFVLKSGGSEATKINGISEEYVPSVIEVFADKYYDIVYFQTNGDTLYKLMSGDTVVNRVVEKASFQFYLSDCNNNTYYTIENDIFAIKSGESRAKKISSIHGQVVSIDIDSSNKLYFATTIGLQVLNAGETTTILLTDTVHVNSLVIDKDDNVYFGTDGGAFVLKFGEVQTIDGIGEAVVKIVVNVNDIYFITSMGHRLFLLQNKLELSKLFENRILGEIDTNDDETILNTLNYLNIGNDYLLNRSKNKVINKTETSAAVVGIKGKYFGQFNVEYTIRSRDRKYFVDIDFLKKAIFFNYINENLFHYKKTNDIKDIEVYIDNLRFGPVEVTKDSNLNSSFEFRNVCDMKKVANSSPVNQIIKFSECNYKGKETVSFEITNGFNKQNDETLTSVLTADDELILSDYLYNNASNSEPVPLSNAFELSNSNFFSKETVLYDFFEPEQEIVVPPKQQISVKYSVRTFNNTIYLKLIQKIHGIIVSKLTDNSDEQIHQITLRNAMQVLEKFSQLPIEVTINDDNSVTFSGKAILTSQRESVPIVIRNFA